MLGGEEYYGWHPEFSRMLNETRERLWEYNNLRPSDSVRREEIIRAMLGGCGEKIHINQPFRCDYGRNIYVSENFFANFNLTILDEAEVRIGDNAFIGPNVSMYTACHPLNAEERNAGMMWAKPITIGNDVWIGGSVTILPGISIGDNAVVGAGSVVTRDVEPGTVVVGNPAKVVKRLSPASEE